MFLKNREKGDYAAGRAKGLPLVSQVLRTNNTTNKQFLRHDPS
jgi:hypothetical protein